MILSKKRASIFFAIFVVVTISGYLWFIKYSASKYSNIAENAWYRKDFVTASEFYKKALSYDKNNIEYRHVFAATLIKLGKHREAKTIFEELLKNDKTNLMYLSSLGHLSNLEGDYQQAREYYEKCVEVAPNNIIGYGGLMTTYKNMKEYKKALAFAKKAVNQLPHTQPFPVENWVAPIQELSELYLITGDKREALEAYKAVLDALKKYQGDTTKAYLDLAKMYEYMENKEKALETYNEFLSIKPKKTDEIYAQERIEAVKNGNFLVFSSNSSSNSSDAVRK